MTRPHERLGRDHCVRVVSDEGLVSYGTPRRRPALTSETQASSVDAVEGVAGPEAVWEGRVRPLLAWRSMLRQPYQSDLSDAEFAYLVPYLPTPKPRGRPWRHPRREILDAIFYVVRTGCQWRALPHEYPPWSTVHDWFRLWRLDGTRERLNGALRERLRVAVGRHP